MSSHRLCLALAVSLSLASSAQAEEEVAKGELLSRYWLEEPLVMSATFGVPNHVFSLSVDGASDKDTQRNLDYSPPQATDLTLAVGYGQFNFSWKQPLPQSSGSKGTYGKSTYDDFSFEWGRERFATSFYYQTFSGFYTDLNGNTGNFARIGKGGDTKDNSSNLNNPPSSTVTIPADIVKRGDISSRHYGAIAWYAFPLLGENSQAFKITFRSIVDTPSPGFNLDLVTSLFYDYAKISAAIPFVPAKRSELFGRGAFLQEVNTHSAGTGLGFATSYVFDGSHFFIDGMFLYGGGAQRQHATYVDDSRWKTVYVDNFNMKMGTGFRMDKHQAGLHFWVNSVGSKVDNLRLTSSNMAIELGYQLSI